MLCYIIALIGWGLGYYSGSMCWFIVGLLLLNEVLEAIKENLK